MIYNKQMTKITKKIAYFSAFLAIFPIIALGASPSVAFSVGPQTVLENASVAISWYSQNTTYCVASGAWSGHLLPFGSTDKYPKEDSSYYITCVGPEGTVSDVKSVFVIKNSTPNISNPIVYQNYQNVFPQINYNAAPSAPFTAACAANPTVAEAGKPVTFVAAENNVASPFSYRWSGDVDGSNSATTAFFNSPGTKTAKVTIFDNRNRAAEGFCSIVVNPPATPAAVSAPIKASPPKIVTTKTEEPCQTTEKTDDETKIETASNNSNSKFFLASLFGSGGNGSNNGGSKSRSILIYLVPAFAALSVIVLGFLIVRLNSKA